MTDKKIMRFNLSSMGIGELIRYKHKLHYLGIISDNENKVITKFLNFVITQEN